MAEADITWAHLVALMMVGGDGSEPSLLGVIRNRGLLPTEVGAPFDIEISGERFRFTDSKMRVMKRGELARRERLDGEVRTIDGAETKWIWLGQDAIPTAFARRTTAWGGSDSELTRRRSIEDWQGDDFTRPGGPPEPTVFLGRAAWRVQLRPPAHKPFPLTLVIDAETGLVLSERNEGFQTITEWTELEVGVSLPDDLFVWTGPVKSQPDHRVEHDAEMARRSEWLRANGIGPLELTLPAAISLHTSSDDGAFEASISTDLSASVARRPHSNAVWELEWGWDHIHRWTSAGWDWALGTQNVLDEHALAEIRRQLESNSA